MENRFCKRAVFFTKNVLLSGVGSLIRINPIAEINSLPFWLNDLII